GRIHFNKLSFLTRIEYEQTALPQVAGRIVCKCGKRQAEDIPPQRKRLLLVFADEQEAEGGKGKGGIAANASGGDYPTVRVFLLRYWNVDESPLGVGIFRGFIGGCFEEFFVHVFGSGNELCMPREFSHVVRPDGGRHESRQF